jgi:hypothetical protein
MLTTRPAQFNAKQARREAQKAAKQDNELRKQIQNVRPPSTRLPSPRPLLKTNICPDRSS